MATLDYVKIHIQQNSQIIHLSDFIGIHLHDAIPLAFKALGVIKD